MTWLACLRDLKWHFFKIDYKFITMIDPNLWVIYLRCTTLIMDETDTAEHSPWLVWMIPSRHCCPFLSTFLSTRCSLPKHVLHCSSPFPNLYLPRHFSSLPFTALFLQTLLLFLFSSSLLFCHLVYKYHIFTWYINPFHHDPMFWYLFPTPSASFWATIIDISININLSCSMDLPKKKVLVSWGSFNF